MKVAPVSGDLLLKLALLAGAGLGVWVLVQRARAALPPDWQLPTVPWSAVNPASDQNLVYQGTSGVISAATGREETLGGWLYTITHPDPVKLPTYETTGIGPGVTVTDGQTYTWGY